MKIIQIPNPPLIVALISLLISKISTGELHRGGLTVYILAISMWSYGEIVDGVNWFRKVLGIVVLLFTAYSLFYQIR